MFALTGRHGFLQLRCEGCREASQDNVFSFMKPTKKLSEKNIGPRVRCGLLGSPVLSAVLAMYRISSRGLNCVRA